jgi:CrcB protein
MSRILLIGCGGFLGSIARYLMSGLVQDRAGLAFPAGTLCVNALGCLVIGAVSEAAEMRGAFSPEARAFVVVGVLGGFTTFSAFGNETINMMREGDRALAGLNVLAQVILGLGAVWAGRALVGLLGR